MNFSLLFFSNLTLALLIAQGPENGTGPIASFSQEIKSGQAPSPDTLIDDPANNRYWRMTQNGWQLIELPAKILMPVFRPARPIPRIHPFQATMLISLAALAAMAWASDEWDWGRLVEDKRRGSSD